MIQPAIVDDSNSQSLGSALPLPAGVSFASPTRREKQKQCGPSRSACDDGGDRPTMHGEALAIADPVRLYLSQIGGTPLLSRDQESTTAQLVGVTRTRFY